MYVSLFISIICGCMQASPVSLFLETSFFFFFIVVVIVFRVLSSDGSTTAFLLMWGLVLDDPQDAPECERDGGEGPPMKKTTNTGIGWEKTQKNTLDDTPHHPTDSSWSSSPAAFVFSSDASALENPPAAATSGTSFCGVVDDRSASNTPAPRKKEATTREASLANVYGRMTYQEGKPNENRLRGVSSSAGVWRNAPDIHPDTFHSSFSFRLDPGANTPYGGAPSVKPYSHASTGMASGDPLLLHGHDLGASTSHPKEEDRHKRYTTHANRRGRPTAHRHSSCAVVASAPPPPPASASPTKALTRSEVAALRTFRAWKEEQQKAVASPKTPSGKQPEDRAREQVASLVLFSPSFAPSSVYSPASLLLQCIMDVCRSPSWTDGEAPAWDTSTRPSSTRRYEERGGHEGWAVGEADERYGRGDEGRSSLASWSSSHDAFCRERHRDVLAGRVARWLVHHIPLLLLASRGGAEEGANVVEGGGWQRWKKACDRACETAPDRCARASSEAVFLPLLLEIVLFYIRMGVLEDLPVPRRGATGRRKTRRGGSPADEEGRGNQRRKWRTNEEEGGRRGNPTPHREEKEEEEEDCSTMSIGIQEEGEQEERKRRKVRERGGEVSHWVCAVFLGVLKELGVFAPLCGGGTSSWSTGTPLSFLQFCSFPPPLPSPLSSSSSCLSCLVGWYWLVLQEWVAAIMSLSLHRHSGSFEPRANHSDEDPSSHLAPHRNPSTGHLYRKKTRTREYGSRPSFPALPTKTVENANTGMSAPPRERNENQQVAWMFFPFLCIEYLLTQGGLTASSSFSAVPSSPCLDAVTQSFVPFQQEKIVQKQMRRKQQELTDRLLAPSSFMDHATAVHHRHPVKAPSLASPTTAPLTSAPPIPATVPSPTPSTLLWCTFPCKRVLWTPKDAMLSLCALVVSHPRYPCLASLVPASWKSFTPYSSSWTKENHPSASSAFSFPPSSVTEEMQPHERHLSVPPSEDCSASTEDVPYWLLFYQQRIAKLWREWNTKFLVGFPVWLPKMEKRTIRTSLPHHNGADYLCSDPFFAAVEGEDMEIPHTWLLLNHILTSL